MTNKWIKVIGEDGIEMDFEVKNIHLKGKYMSIHLGNKKTNNEIIKKNLGEIK